MKNISRAALVLGVGFAATAALAQETEMRPYVTGGYDHVFADNSRDSDSGMGYSLGVGKALSERWGVEVSAFHHLFDAEGAGGKNWREYGVKADGLFFYSRNASFSPYFGAGLGFAENDIKNGTGGSSGDLMADAGLGFFKFFKSTDLGVRGDLRYRWIDTADIAGVGTFEEPVIKVGLVMPLGPKSAAAAAVAADQLLSGGKPKPGDADGDGVLDDNDNCPGTQGGVVVDAKGCAVDTDGDGVADNLDRCPTTARGLSVDAKGCPASAADLGANRSFENVYFAFDKDELTDYAKATLDNAASVIGELAKKYPALKVDLAGHTDWMGTDAYNQALSERRANVVKGYLARKGVDAKSVSTFAYGESKPAAPNDTDEGRALNRRTEIRTHE